MVPEPDLVVDRLGVPTDRADRAVSGTGGPAAAGASSAGRMLTRGGAITMLRLVKAPS